MKNLTRLCLAFALSALITGAQAATIAANDSIVSLATNGTKYYTFVDSGSGHFVEVALTMSAISTDPADVLTSLDGNTRLGVGNPAISGDGNNISTGEGVSLSASVVTVSSGVAANTITFRVAGLGIRNTGGGISYWISSASGSNTIALSTESVYPLDASGAALFGTAYTGKLRAVSGSGDFQLTDAVSGGLGLSIEVSFTATANGDPRTNTWFTAYTSRYARIYTNNTQKAAGTSLTTWSNGSQTQSSPAYAGVQAVYSSSNWVYLKTSGMGQHVMGPWSNGSFPNLPKNQNVLYRIPRSPTVPATKTLTGLGAIGYFVDGVAMFDSRDGFVWTGSAESGNGTGYWNREAYMNEGATFDPGYAHQEQTGTHHYHANPIALRYLLGDHVNYDASTKNYSEATNAVTKHSPILGWVRDGYPVYGPYAYSNALDASSPLIRMRSGFQLRNGLRGTQNLTTVGRTNIPAWAVRLYNVSAAQSGPTVSGTYPLARYMEDYDFIGDTTNALTGTNYLQGVDFDLDVYNGRYCVTPEFPNGTYAYFVSIDSAGTPVFPNNIGRAFYGSPTGNTTTLAETLATNFLGGANLREVMNTPTKSGNNVTLTWSAVEGGTYRVESSTNLTSWITNTAAVAANQSTGSNSLTTTDPVKFFRVNRAFLANYDGFTAGGGGVGTFAVPGGSVSRGTGTNITLTITLPGTPPSPPAGAPITSVTMGSLTATSTSYTTQGTVLANFTIPSNATLGAQNVVVTFNIPVFTFTGGFTINP